MVDLGVTKHKGSIQLILLAGIALYVVVMIVSQANDLFWMSALIPSALGLVWLATFRIRYLYYFLWFFIPLSAEVMVTQRMALDIPGEPLLIILSFLALLILVKKGLVVHKKTASLSIMALVILHIFWVFFTCLFSDDLLTSTKFLMAKTWYVLPFFVLPFFILDRKRGDYEILIKCFLIGLMIAGAYVFYQHFQEGLSFSSRTNVGSPIFRNHVNYSSILTIALPCVWYLYRRSRFNKWLYLGIACILLIFLYFTYARVAYVAIFAAFVGLMIIRMKWLLGVCVVGVLALLVGVVYLFHNNNYLNYSPDYEQAISHHKFDRLLSATYRGEDVSSMERVYRWVAGVHMIIDKPWVGFGPGRFYENYKRYTVHGFKTYVSDNPDKSGIHNYYLMLVVEQGILGLVIFLSLLIVILARAQHLFHNIRQRGDKDLLSMAIMILFMICTINLINDMFEVIKVGSFFFLSAHIVARNWVDESDLARENYR